MTDLVERLREEGGFIGNRQPAREAMQEAANVLENPYTTPHWTADNLGRIVDSILGEEEARIWWETEQPQFGGISAKDMWFRSFETKWNLIDFVLSALDTESVL